jgi:hypothetical protein
MNNIRFDSRQPAIALYSEGRSVVAIAASNEDRDLEPGFVFMFSSGTELFLCTEALEAMQVAMRESQESAIEVYGNAGI